MPHNNPPNPVPKLLYYPDSDPSLSEYYLSGSSDPSDDEYYKKNTTRGK